MFRLDNVLEQWAQIFEPIQHDPSAKSTRRTFFRISMIDQQSYFVRNFNLQPSPCMAYATHVDADMEGSTKFISYRHVVYFLVKQANNPQKNAVTDELAATEARYDTDDMVQELLAFLSEMQTAANNGLDSIDVFGHEFPIAKDERQGWRGLQIKEAHWGTLPTMFNGWELCGLTIGQQVPRRLCLTPSMYIPAKP